MGYGFAGVTHGGVVVVGDVNILGECVGGIVGGCWTGVDKLLTGGVCVGCSWMDDSVGTTWTWTGWIVFNISVIPCIIDACVVSIDSTLAWSEVSSSTLWDRSSSLVSR